MNRSMARRRLRQRQVKRIKSWRANTGEELGNDDAIPVYDEDELMHNEDHELDVGELQSHPIPEADATFERAPSMEEGGIDFRVQRRTSSTLTKWLKKGAKVAFSPVSLPVRAILYAQRHWEEFLWGHIEAAVQRHQAAHVPETSTTQVRCVAARLDHETGMLQQASRNPNPGAFTTDLPFLAGSAVPALAAPPSPPQTPGTCPIDLLSPAGLAMPELSAPPSPPTTPGAFPTEMPSLAGSSVLTLLAPPSPASVAISHESEGSENMAMLRALEEVSLEYSYLPLVHALNPESSRVIEVEPPTSSRTSGYVSRLEMSRENLETHNTIGSLHLMSLGCERADALRSCGLVSLQTRHSGHTIDIRPPRVPDNTMETEPFPNFY